ncbi:uncharacterized protein LOC6049386 [Culex quinquefasciatus]|uniref:uncharacterized protein LOC6049386 n=1 Tax=Culex quinquefasciatus TaxID=7176 RepID=UPI0018E3C1B4|nr:uncharacterized protein LOC6049386 [Culex quinquefasciatus]
MKLIIFFAALIAAVVAQNGCVRDDSDGRPACNAAEVTQGRWRNNWDPTAYWVCTTAGTAATLVRCPTEGMFDPITLNCINWFDWVWQPTCRPPSALA